MLFIKAVDRINKVLEVCIGLALALMTIVVFIQVLVRFVLTTLGWEIAAPWTEELARYLMIWLVFIGGAVAARKGRLIAVEALAHALPAKIGKGIKFLSQLISLVFYGIILWVGIEWAKFGASETAPVMRFSMTYVYSAMSAGAAAMILNTITFMLDLFLNKKDVLAHSDEEEEIIREMVDSDERKVCL